MQKAKECGPAGGTRAAASSDTLNKRMWVYRAVFSVCSGERQIHKAIRLLMIALPEYTVNMKLPPNFGLRILWLTRRVGACIFRSIPRSNSIINRNQKSIHWTTGRKLGGDSQFAWDHRYVWKPNAKERHGPATWNPISKRRAAVFPAEPERVSYARSGPAGEMVTDFHGKLVVMETFHRFSFYLSFFWNVVHQLDWGCNGRCAFEKYVNAF